MTGRRDNKNTPERNIEMKDYYLGLSMGTKSVGWAVTDTDYNLLRKKGKDAWGVRRFAEAQSCADRTNLRCTRRLKNREKARIDYVRDIFADAVNAADPDFFRRLEDSRFYVDDKEIQQPFALFADPEFTDREYHKVYPTVFHLRSDLLHTDEERDVRLVYLAVLNIFKRRGHFLNANLGGDDIPAFEDIYAQIADASDNIPSAPDLETVKGLLSSDSISNIYRSRRIAEALGITAKMAEADAVKLICGLKGTVSKLFPEHEFEDEYRKFSFNFREAGYDEKEPVLQEILSEEEFDYVRLLKQAHDWGLLVNIMSGEEYLSDARVKAYNRHAEDLALLKTLYRKYAPDRYRDMFRVMKDYNYSAYVGHVNSRFEKKRRGAKKGTKCQEELYKKIKADFKGVDADSDDDVRYMFAEMDNGTFLKKQLSSENRIIPNQVHLKELKKILENAGRYLPFLNEKDESGLTATERLCALFSFRIPYYIGPLYNNGAPNTWVVRKETGKVFPWNIDQKIDVKASSEAFIDRMVGECTYLPGQKVLPKSSLLYEKFKVLQEINTIRINGAPISVDLKKAIFNDLFRKYDNVTVKRVETYAAKYLGIAKGEPVEISGVNDGFNTSLSSLRKFCAIFGTDVLSYEQEQIAEKIIFWSTVYGDAAKFLRERIEENYSGIFSEEQLRRIHSLHFKAWGELSEAFLKLPGEKNNAADDRPRTIIDRMWEANVNLMEVLGSGYTYMEEVQRRRDSAGQKTLEEITYEDLEDLYVSAPVRRMIWQTVLTLREVIGVMGHAPAKVFLEVDKDSDIVNKKRRGITRKRRLRALYALYEKDRDKGRDWVKEIDDTESGEFLSKKLYLYYMQKGRCMYTGEPIPLKDLFNNDLYNIDHIYPRQVTADENIEKNLVLVKKSVNREKDNKYPVAEPIRRQQAAFWKELCVKQYITREKYERLIRSTPFTEEELADFIGLRLTDRRQGTKVISALFRATFPGTEVCHANAGAASDFRRKFGFVRCTDIGEAFRAKDAYVNIVVGNCYDVKFTKSPLVFIKEQKKDPKAHKYHMMKVFDYTIRRDDEYAWIVEEDRSINTVRTVMSKSTPMMTMRNYVSSGQLWNMNPLSAKTAGSGSGYVPLKTKTDGRLLDVSKYGGYANYTGAHFFLVEHTVKEKRVRTLETMPLYLMKDYDTAEKIVSYCTDVLGLEDPDVRIAKIKMYSPIRVDGFPMYLTGRSLARLSIRSAPELKLPEEWERYVKKLFNGRDLSAEQENEEKDTGITRDSNLALYRLLAEKNQVGIFGKRPNSIGKQLFEWEEKFKKLKTLEDQADILKAVIMYDSGKISSADLKAIGGAAHTGAATLNNNVLKYHEFKLIAQSPAGFYTKEIDLKTV